MKKKIWTAAELHEMTPAEVAEISDAAIVPDLDDAPQHLVENARQFVEARIAAEESTPTN